MRKAIISLWILLTLILPVSALELEVPQVPDSAESYMPNTTDRFSDGLLEMLNKAIPLIRPDLAQASKSTTSIIAVVLIVSILQAASNATQKTANFAGVAAISAILLMGTNSLISLAADTVEQMCEYGKLLLPVMTAALAAQGGVSSSAALYGGTVLFNSILGSLIRKLFVPMVYLFLAMSAGGCALEEDILKKLRSALKGFIGWCLKTLLTVFTAYMGITGILTGSTDAAALKATKVTIATFVPVVGGILSDASEAILVSAGLAKNAAGLYGIFALLALFLEPFLKIGVHYLLLKITAFLTGLFGTKQMTELLEDYSSAMGLLLAMTGSTCLLQLISTICFMKGAA